MRYTDPDWRPTRVIDVGVPEKTSTGVTRVATDAGDGYCKVLGNRQGPHALACEWACVRLAKWFGLPTFKAAIVELSADRAFPLPEHKGRNYHAEPGPAFVTQATQGRQWDSTAEDLNRLINPDAITRLVCFDMWVRNRDRHHHAREPNYGNVFFVRSGAGYRLVAMDHTHCFDNGVLSVKLAHIDAIQDESLYGRFPEFAGSLSGSVVRECETRLALVTRELVEPIVDEIPREWHVDGPIRSAWIEMLIWRARFLESRLAGLILPLE